MAGCDMAETGTHHSGAIHNNVSFMLVFLCISPVSILRTHTQHAHAHAHTHTHTLAHTHTHTHTLLYIASRECTHTMPLWLCLIVFVYNDCLHVCLLQFYAVYIYKQEAAAVLTRERGVTGIAGRWWVNCWLIQVHVFLFYWCTFTYMYTCE